MPVSTTFVTDELEVHVHAAGTETVVHVFGNAEHLANGEDWLGARIAARMGVSVVALVPRRRNFFPRDDTVAALERAAASVGPTTRRVCVGTSMGAYGAIRFGRVIGAHHTLALAPIFGTDPEDCPFDRGAYTRYHDERTGRRNAIRAEDLSGDIVVVYDPLFAADAPHARAISALGPITAIEIPFTRHAHHLFAGTGRLVAAIEATIAGDAEALRRQWRAHRHDTPRQLVIVADRLRARDRGCAGSVRRRVTTAPAHDLANRLCVVTALTPTRPRATTLCELRDLWRGQSWRLHRSIVAERLARFYAEEGRLGRALVWQRRAIAASGEDPGTYGGLVGSAIRAGRLDRARELFEARLVAPPPSAFDRSILTRGLSRLAVAGGALAEGIDLGLEALRQDPIDADLALHVLQALLRAGRRAEAADLVTRCRDHLSSADIHHLAGHLAEHGGGPSAALGPARAAFAADRGREAFFRRLCTLLLAAGHVEDCETFARAHMHLHGAAAHDYAALALVRRGRASEASDLLAAGVARFPGVVALEDRLIAHLATVGDTDAAAVRIAAALTARPGAARPWAAQSQLLRRRGDLTGAIAAARRAHALEPGAAEHADALASALVAHGDFEAAEAVHRARLADHRSAHALRGLGVVFERGGRLEAAIDVTAEAAALEPGDAQVRLRWGTLLAAAARWDEAISRFDEALVLKPDLIAARRGLATAAERSGDANRAIRELEGALTSAPSDAGLWAMLGDFRAKSGATEAAEAALRQAVALDPRLPLPQRRLIDLLATAGRPADAAEAAGLAAGHLPDDVVIWIRWGTLALGANDLPTAEHALRRACALAPQLAAPVQRLSVCLERAGRFDEARAAARRGADLAPADAMGWARLGELELRCGDVGAAEAALRRALDLAPDLPAPRRRLAELAQRRAGPAGPTHDG
jgi:tetratricopeptide (TPR) repeat protein